MKEWIHQISKLASSLDSTLDDVREWIAQLLNIEDPFRVLPYRGYGTRDSFLVKGRVLKDEGIKLREQSSSMIDNVIKMFKRFATDEVPHARLQVRYGSIEEIVTANQEGFFTIEISPKSQLQEDWWRLVDISLIEPCPKQDSVLEQAEVLLVSDQAEFGVISDIDDTIVHTAAFDLLKMIRIVYLGSAESRQPFEGVADFYTALQTGLGSQPQNPIFYVSSSAWNMYDVFARFMEINHIPKGPMLLKDIEFSLESLLTFTHEAHKREQIEPILERFPELPFLLIGDSGQRDPEIYSRLVEQYPDRILAVLIRNVVPFDGWRRQELNDLGKQITAAGSQFLLFEETEQARNFAIANGWISNFSH
ncbi:MAG: App1 family protein [Leptolyngbyaceae cyanobacterium]